MGRLCAASRARKLSRTLTVVYDSALRSLGIRSSQLTILAAVGAHDERSPGDLETSLNMDQSTISRNVSRMCAKGWLATVPSGNGRGHHVIITPKGRRLLVEAIPLWREAQDRARLMLGEQGLAALAELVDDLPTVGEPTDSDPPRPGGALASRS
jgi:DNA-binding MarR family transcriptional regulator